MRFIQQIFRRRDRIAPTIPEGERVYAIGDIHGRSDLLEALLERIDADLAGSGDRCELVFLGDYIDRGEDSRGVLDLCVERSRCSAVTHRFLMGNHERAALDFLEDPARGQGWLAMGGLETLASYRVEGASLDMPSARAVSVANRWRELLAPDHLAFLESLELTRRIGGYFFCHAGVDPLSGVEAQPADVLLWGAQGGSDRPWRAGLKVVHGHYAAAEPVLRAHRICVDTMAYVTGRLTAVRLMRDETAFLHTGG